MFGDKKGITAPLENVVDKYLEWKGSADDGYFVSYDKETQKTNKVEVGGLIVLKENYAIRGFHAASNQRIWSNKVDDLSKEMVARAGKETIIYEGVYSELKEKMKSEKMASLHYVITALTDKGEVVEFGLKGTSFAGLVDIFKEVDTNEFKIKPSTPEEGKAGAIKYKICKWKQGAEINKEEKEVALAIVERMKPVETKEEEISVENIPF